MCVICFLDFLFFPLFIRIALVDFLSHKMAKCVAVLRPSVYGAYDKVLIKETASNIQQLNYIVVKIRLTKKVKSCHDPHIHRNTMKRHCKETKRKEAKKKWIEQNSQLARASEQTKCVKCIEQCENKSDQQFCTDWGGACKQQQQKLLRLVVPHFCFVIFHRVYTEAWQRNIVLRTMATV